MNKILIAQFYNLATDVKISDIVFVKFFQAGRVISE